MRRSLPRAARRRGLRSARLPRHGHRRPDDGIARSTKAWSMPASTSRRPNGPIPCVAACSTRATTASRPPGRCGIPHLIVPGCIDMANFGPLATVPQKYRDAGRTALRVESVGHADADKRRGESPHGRRSSPKRRTPRRGPVAFLIPLRGVSILDGDGQPFCDRAGR